MYPLKKEKKNGNFQSGRIFYLRHYLYQRCLFYIFLFMCHFMAIFFCLSFTWPNWTPLSPLYIPVENLVSLMLSALDYCSKVQDWRWGLVILSCSWLKMLDSYCAYLQLEESKYTYLPKSCQRNQIRHYWVNFSDTS